MFKRKYIIILWALLFIILIFTILFIKNNSHQSPAYEQSSIRESELPQYLEESKLTQYLREYQHTKYSIDILRVENYKIYGAIQTNEYDQVLFSTIGIFIYDVKEDKFEFKSFSNNERLIDFILLEDKFYYCTLSYGENDTYKWNLYSDTWNTEYPLLIENGSITNLFEYPRMKYLNANTVIILSKHQIENTVKCKICSIDSNGNVKELLNKEGDLSTNKGTLLYNNDSLLVKDNKLYYTVLNSDNSQALILYDLEKLKEYTIYTNTDDSKALSLFIIADDFVFLQLTDKTNNENNTNIIINQNKEEIYRFSSGMLTFANLINNETILFHNSGNVWQLFKISDKENNLQTLESNINEINNIFPKYFVIDKNRIFVQTFTNEFYCVDIET